MRVYKSSISVVFCEGVEGMSEFKVHVTNVTVLEACCAVTIVEITCLASDVQVYFVNVAAVI